MSHERGAYLGGVRDLETLRERCVMGKGGCWHFRMPRSGRAASQTASHQVFVHQLGRKLSATRAAWLFSRGELPTADVRIQRACTSYDCLCPEHLVKRTLTEAFAAAKARRGALWDTVHRVKASLASRKRANAKLNEELAQWARESPQSARDVAHGLGIAASRAIAVRAGRAWVQERQLASAAT